MYWELSSIASVKDEFGLQMEQYGPPLLRLLLVDPERLGSADRYRGIMLEDVLNIDELHQSYRRVKPFGKDVRIQQVSDPEYKPSGTALALAENGLVRGRLNSTNYEGPDDFEQLDADTLTTGSPVARVSLGAPLKELFSQVWDFMMAATCARSPSLEPSGVILRCAGFGQLISAVAIVYGCFRKASCSRQRSMTRPT